ncbi:unnamed protein product [Leptidea sinapis]|uniref:Uncharacterized protein n=1 Tax=Leptidea sinapis TaxID=189913 RepID=A0A5E4PM95_9NEOP|nr:unnamed protein product [Leptidea sinapis]
MSVSSAKAVKCTSCNIVISEVLAFIRNTHDVVDSESLKKICASAFAQGEIDEAKELLFIYTKSNKKQVSRRKNKKHKDLEDMITVFKTIDPEQIPMFVAYDLHKLPVCFDQIDVDVTKLDELDEKSKPINSNNYVNTKRGGYIEKECSVVDVTPDVACASVQREPTNDHLPTEQLIHSNPEVTNEIPPFTVPGVGLLYLPRLLSELISGAPPNNI